MEQRRQADSPSMSKADCEASEVLPTPLRDAWNGMSVFLALEGPGVQVAFRFKVHHAVVLKGD